MATPEELQRIRAALLMQVAQRGGDLTPYQTNIHRRQSMRPELDRRASIIAEDPQLQEQLARAGGPADIAGIQVRPAAPQTDEEWRADFFQRNRADPMPWPARAPQESPAATSERERWAGLPVADRVGEINRALAAQQAPAQPAPAPQPMAKTANGVSALTMGGAAPPPTTLQIGQPTIERRVPAPTTTVQVGRPAQVDVPRTAVMESFGRPPSGDITTPAPVGGDVRQALNQSTGRVAELEEALRQRSGRQLLATLLRAGGTAIGRGRGPAYDALDAAAGQPLEDLALRQRAQEAERVRALSLGDDDPSSQQSQMARSLLTQVLPGLEQQPGFERMSYARLAQGPMGGLVKMVMESAAKRQEAATRAEERGEMLDFRREEAAGRRQDRAAQRDLTRMLGVMGLQDRLGRREEAEVERAGKETQGFARANEGLVFLEKLAATPANRDMPGFGPIDSLKPDILSSDEDVKARQSALQVVVDILRQVSGAAVTPQEAQRFMEAYGIRPGAKESSTKSGLKALTKRLRAELQATMGKYRPETLEELRRRGGFAGFSPPAEGETGGLTPEEQAELEALERERGR